MNQLYLSGMQQAAPVVFKSLNCRDITLATRDGQLAPTPEHAAFKCQKPATLQAIYFEYVSAGSATCGLDSICQDSNKIYACGPDHLKEFLAYAQDAYFLKFPDIIIGVHGRQEEKIYSELFKSIMAEDLPKDYFNKERTYSNGIESLQDIWEREKHQLGF